MEKKARLSSYKKMKQKYEQEILELKTDIIALVDESDFIKSSTVKAKWQFALRSERVALLGGPTVKRGAEKEGLKYPVKIAGFRVLSVFGKSALSKSEKSATEFNVLWRQFPDDVDKETKFLRVESKLGNVFWYIIHDYHTQFPIFTCRGPHGWFDNNWLNKRPVETPRIEQPPHETMYWEWLKLK